MIKQKQAKTVYTVLAIDPGLDGAFVVTNGIDVVESFAMPLRQEGADRMVDFQGIFDLLRLIKAHRQPGHVFLERAVPFAMGSKGAFSYGRGFEAVTIAVKLWKLPLTLVEPAKWTKAMHAGTKADLKPKARSAIAVGRLYPQLVGLLPQKPKGGLQEGPMDALLIAGYGLRTLNLAPTNVPPPPPPIEDLITDFW